MKKDIIVPAAGESVTEADIVSWYKSNGEYVEMDEPLVELETDKASMDLAAEVSGVLTISVTEGTVEVGDVIGSILPGEAKKDTNTPVSTPEKTPTEPSETAAPSEEKSAKKAETKPYPSPAASKLSKEKQVDLAAIKGSGKDGRITKADVQSASATQTVQNVQDSSPTPSKEDRTLKREKMSRIRKTIMNRMVSAQQTAAMLTTFNEVDMSAIMAIRKQYKDSFKEKYQVGLGFMSFFTKACCLALQSFPIIQAQVDGKEILHPNYCDIGIAVSTPKGLVVPVIRDAETLSFRDIEKQILDFALRGREGNLSLDDMQGGTFTITNGGTFGSMMSTPILNHPQSAILGMHNIVQRPMAINNEVVIRPMMYLALTYDHRIIDGADAVQFLVLVKHYLEDPTRLLIEV